MWYHYRWLNTINSHHLEINRRWPIYTQDSQNDISNQCQNPIPEIKNTVLWNLIPLWDPHSDEFFFHSKNHFFSQFWFKCFWVKSIRKYSSTWNQVFQHCIFGSEIKFRHRFEISFWRLCLYQPKNIFIHVIFFRTAFKSTHWCIETHVF